MSVRVRRGWVLFVAFFAAAIVLHVASGAVVSDIGAHPDEPAHFTTGLLFHDYVAAGLPGDPLRFAEAHHLHYPASLLGTWPPAFHAAQALWMLVFGTSNPSLVGLLALLAAAVALGIRNALREELGELVAVVAAALFLLLPLVQRYTGLVLTEVPLALLALLAVESFGRFLSHGRRRDALAFGAFALLGLLTAVSALALALLPPFAIAVSGRWERLRSPWLWCAVALVLALGAPWYALTPSVLGAAVGGDGGSSLGFAPGALGSYAQALPTLAGWTLLAVATLGFVVACARRRAEGGWSARVAFVPAVLALHVTLPGSLDERHLMLLAPQLVMFVALGALSLAAPLRLEARRRAPLVLAALGAFGLERFEVPRKEFFGYEAVARVLLDDPDLDDGVLLIASDVQGEGLFVAGVARNEERPGHVVLRATKVLGRGAGSGSAHEPLFDSPEELQAYLESIPVAIVVLDEATAPDLWYEHQTMLRRLLERNELAWTSRGRADAIRAGERFEGALRVFELRGHRSRPRREIELAEARGESVSGF